MIVRGRSWRLTMSQYLVDRIRALTQCRSSTAHSDLRVRRRGGLLTKVELEEPRHERGAGASHRACLLLHWCRSQYRLVAQCGITLDDKGFVITVVVAATCWPLVATASSRWAMCVCGSVKRVAAAVGEGSIVVSAIHAWLAQRRERKVEGEVMADDCTHLDTIRKVTPGTRGCEECLSGAGMVSLAGCPCLRPCRLL